MNPLKNILVATDFSAAAATALVYGRELARAFGATLHVLHVVEHVFVGPFAADPDAIEEAALESLNARLTDDDRTLLRARVVVELSHSPAKAIVAYARATGIDLIVTGTHARHGARRVLLGSVAEQVIETAPCPVLTVKHVSRPVEESGMGADRPYEGRLS